MARKLKNQVVLITGATAGIGLALARRLAARGAKLALVARRGQLLQQICTQLGGESLPIVGDVRRPEDCARMVATCAEHFGRIDTLVCNAGHGVYRTVADTDAEGVRGLFEAHVLGVTECVRAAVPIMSVQQPVDGWCGQIMIVSSAAARRGTPYLGVYSGMKAAQLAIAEALRVELRPASIAVTSVHPIMTSTDFRFMAEALGTVKLPKSPRWLSQSAECVAQAMERGIARPTAEVWPHALSRWGLLLTAFIPALGDWGMERYRRAVARANEKG